MRNFFGVLVFSTLLMGSAANAMPLLLNGSFETGTDPGAFQQLFAGSTAITGWQVSGEIDYIGSIWQASDGNRSLDLEGVLAGAVSQSFATEIGHRYEVSFDLAGNPVSSGIKTVRVSAAGTSQDYGFDTTGQTLGDMGWESQLFVFFATGTSTTLSFEGIAPGTGFGAALDNVGMVATPEPSTALLLAAGLSGLAAMGRRRTN